MKRIVKVEFHAAHHITGHPKCGKTHGHTYNLEVVVDCDGWVDFHDIRYRVALVLQGYDHTDMGDMTCEKLASQLYKRLKEDAFPLAKEIKLRLFETREFGVEYP